jgi:glucose/arabinose dehydrogenase
MTLSGKRQINTRRLARARAMPARRRLLLAAAQLLAAMAVLLAVVPERSAAAPVLHLPPGFTDGPVASVRSPTAVAFTPDGRMLVATQGGLVRVYRAGSLELIRNALVLVDAVCANQDRGLLALAVDPDFASNRFIYLYYTYNKHGVCPESDPFNPHNPVNRVSRFVLGDNNRIDPGSEVVLIDNIHSVDGDHNGADLKFGQDGYLYVSVGDNDCSYMTGLCGSANDLARYEHHLLGKVLRITRNGAIPPDNPFLGPGSDRCHLSGSTEPGRRCQETYAMGLRNPFRMAFDPNASGTRFFINDVGQREWEAVYLGQAGADYGWPCREGSRPNVTTGLCDPEPPGIVNPVYEYPHTSGCSAITGAAFAPNGAWPAEYDGAYLFGDYVCGTIFSLKPNGSGGYTAHTFATGMGRNSATSLTFGPHKDGLALYYTTYAEGGHVRRIAYSEYPVAEFSLQPASGPVPLTVTFDATASNDPFHSPLAYDWNFGDGGTRSGATSPIVTHTYTTAGNFTVTLQVRNSGGLQSDPYRRALQAGNNPPQPVITLPSGAAGGIPSGQVVVVSGSASDPEEGSLPASALDWEVRLHHIDEFHPDNAHYHPLHAESGVSQISFVMPPPEDLEATRYSYIQVLLTATDSHGASATASAEIQPRRVAGRFETSPSGLQLEINAEFYTMPRDFVLWQGWTFSVAAPAGQTDSSGRRWAFDRWANGSAASHLITVPSTDQTYTAIYTAAGEGPNLPFRLFLPLVTRQ